jgi:tetratricopeptide (TPR) repeat protein
MTLTFSKITLIIIAWSLLLPIYLGNANVRTSVIAQNSEDEEPQIDEEAENGDEEAPTVEAPSPPTVEPPPDEQPLTTTNETLTEDLGDNQATEPQQQPMQPGLNATDAGNALEYYDRALAIDPNNVSALDGKGAALHSLGEYQDALEYYDRALAIDPNDVNIVNNKAGALGNLGRYEEAMEYIDRALAIDPNDVNIVNNKGTALFYLGREEEALEYYDRALAIDPNDVNIVNNKGTTLAELGRYEEAIGYYDRVLNIDPNYIPALVNKGAALGNLGRHQEALKYFETTSLIQESSITMAPYYSNVDLQLDNLRRDKEETYALHFISHGYEIDINKETNTGIAKFNLGDPEGAMAIFDEILRLDKLHHIELVQKPELVASLYYKDLCLKALKLTGAKDFMREAQNLDPKYEGDYVPKADFSVPVLALEKLIPLP